MGNLRGVSDAVKGRKSERTTTKVGVGVETDVPVVTDLGITHVSE